LRQEIIWGIDGYSWNVGIKEYWNNGFWDAGVMICWVNVPDKNKKKLTSYFKNIIPIFHFTIDEAKT
jgi:hypothetical protein